MRILLISGDYPPAISGMGDYSRQLAFHLNALGHKVIVMTSKTGASQNQDGIEILRQMETWDFSSWDTLKTAIKIWNPDVVHLQYMTNTFGRHLFACLMPSLIKAAFHGLKIVTTFHEFAAPLNRLGLLPLLFSSDAYLVTNHHHQRMLSKITSALHRKQTIHKIPLAANILPVGPNKENRSLIREQLGVAPEEILLIRFGILHDIAVPQILKWLKIFARMRQNNMPVKLLLVGKGEPRAKAKIMEQIHLLGLEHQVQVKTDLAADVISAYLCASDIGLALYPDGLSEKRTAALALFAHELPVLALQKQPLAPEFRNDENVLCVSHQESDNAWIEAVKKIIADEAFRRRLIQEGSKISQLHDWAHIARQTEQVYTSLKPS